MGSSSHENGGDEPRVSKPATVFLGDLSLSGEGPGFCGYSGPTHANTVNYDLGSHKEHYLHQPQPEGEKGGLADRMNRNKVILVILGFCFTSISYLQYSDFLRHMV